jgi:predicted O-linked N-acetylglucosamine transferase (SPINDLY family)
MGVPVVTRLGETVVGRAGWSQLCNLGLRELAADSDESFIRIATGLARDLPRLAGLRAGLRARMEASPLMDGPRFARNLESALRGLWAQWCAQTTR